MNSQPAINMDTTYGVIFVGLVCSAVLYGVTLLQTFLYYRQYPRDSIWLKSTVGLLAVLDTTHLIFCTISMYWYLIMNFSNPNALGKQIWAMNLQTDLNGLAGYIVQIFFARRVWRLSERNYLLTGVILLLATIHFSFGILFTVETFILVENTKFDKLVWITVPGLGSAAGADLIIAASLCYYLMRNKSGFSRRTDSLIITLVGYSLTTGLLTGIIALTCAVCFVVMPSNYIWMAFFWLIGKVYVNSLLAALNSRDYFREKISGQEATIRLALSRPEGNPRTPVHTITFERQNSDTIMDVRSSSPALTVSMDTEMVVKTDSDSI